MEFHPDYHALANAQESIDEFLRLENDIRLLMNKCAANDHIINGGSSTTAAYDKACAEEKARVAADSYAARKDKMTKYMVISMLAQVCFIVCMLAFAMPNHVTDMLELAAISALLSVAAFSVHKEAITLTTSKFQFKKTANILAGVLTVVYGVLLLNILIPDFPMNSDTLDKMASLPVLSVFFGFAHPIVVLLLINAGLAACSRVKVDTDEQRLQLAREADQLENGRRILAAQEENLALTLQIQQLEDSLYDLEEQIEQIVDIDRYEYALAGEYRRLMLMEATENGRAVDLAWARNAVKNK